MDTKLTKTGDGVIARLSKAYRALQAKAKPVPAPDLGQQNPSALYYPRPWAWPRQSKTDYRGEVGPLEFNSLSMAVCNFTAIRIPEARPAVVRTTKEGDQEFDFNHPAAKLIRRPNKHNIWANYAGSCSMGWWFAGNVYFYKSRSITGEVVELWNLPHFLVEPRWPGDGRTPDVVRWAAEHGEKSSELDPFISHYEYRVPGKAPVLYPAKDVIHLKRHVDLARPRSGLGAFESLYEELGGDRKMAIFAYAIMSNMGLQVPIITPKDETVLMSRPAAEAIKEGWIQKTTGGRAGEPVVLDAPFTVEKFGFNPTELDLSALRLIPESRVCAVCQISPAALQVMVGIQNGTSYASSEQARQQGYEEVIIPIQAVWAEEFTYQLLSEFEDSEGAEFVFDTTNVRVLQEDQDAKVKRCAEIFKAGASTLDQFLTDVGKKPVGPPLGDVRMVPGLSTPMSPERLIEMASEKPEPKPSVPIDPATLAKFVDADAYIKGLEEQMQEFMAK